MVSATNPWTSSSASERDLDMENPDCTSREPTHALQGIIAVFCKMLVSASCVAALCPGFDGLILFQEMKEL